jgi:hypothetical protein
VFNVRPNEGSTLKGNGHGPGREVNDKAYELDFLRCQNPFRGFVLEIQAVEEGNEELLRNIGFLHLHEDVMPM